MVLLPITGLDEFLVHLHRWLVVLTIFRVDFFYFFVCSMTQEMCLIELNQQNKFQMISEK